MEKASVEITTAGMLLRQIHPFRFLRERQRRDLGADLREIFVSAGEPVYRRGDEDDSLYLVAHGAVEIVETRGGVESPLSIVGPNQYFGEWEAVFREPRVHGALARSDCRLYTVPGDRFRLVLRQSPSCAQGFATILRVNQGIFAGFDRFTARLLKEADEGRISVEGLLPLYRELCPAIHPGAAEDHRLDGAALQYALRRLPENVTRTFAFLLVDEFPYAFDEAARLFPKMPSAARRRDVWEMMPGKNMVLLRNGRSDLIDLVTCLCLYAVESRKIRERLVRERVVERLSHYMLNRSPDEDPRGFLDTLPFSSREMRSLLAAWPDDPVSRLYEIVRHREMFSIDVRRQRRNYNLRRGEAWTAEVARATRELLGLDPTELPPEQGVHIVSSNTHSVTNCLNPWYRDNHQLLCSWGAETGHPALEGSWTHERDKVYALARDYFNSFPDAAEEARSRAAASGQLRLSETASTGIQVQLIDLSRLRGERYDDAISPVCGTDASCADLIVNIDYAFGHQALYTIRNLLMLFGENVRSVNLLGKAGALVGQRGDILIPTAFIEQQNDQFHPLPATHGEEGRALEESYNVHRGPMLTVEGTLLQNRRMLSFYREIWNVIAMEMEGAHYFRQILESRQLGVISREVKARFLYYISDLPLAEHAGLTVPMVPAEGVPPLYAVTRFILNQIILGGSS
ncbi:MAG: hypothetical protein EA427_12955 [Spirochaetaceae bacterium]|nr:MAG: hypothetical protein EA427_12955 [Spirochaetaceae bacterium]